MKATDFLTELRRNPKQNPAKLIGDRGALQWIQQNIPRGEYANYGVSLTHLPKLGVNPRSHYNTPIGIYFYPMAYYVKQINLGKTMPFPDDPKYIQIFKLDSSMGDIVDLADMTEQQYQYYINKLQELSHRTNMFQNMSKNFLDDVIHDAPLNSRVDSPGGYFWNVLWVIVNDTYKIVSGTKPSVMWNWLSRQLGIAAFIDTKSIIHENEPTQGVVLDPKAARLVQTLPASATGRITPSSDPAQSLSSMVPQLIVLLKKRLDKTFFPAINKYVKYFNYLFNATPKNQRIHKKIDEAVLLLRASKPINSSRRPVINDEKVLQDFQKNTEELLLNSYAAQITSLINDIKQQANIINNMKSAASPTSGNVSSWYGTTMDNLRRINYELYNLKAPILTAPQTDAIAKITQELQNYSDYLDKLDAELQSIFDRLRNNP